MAQESADTSTAKSAVLRGAAGVLRLRVLLAVLLLTIVTMATPVFAQTCPTTVTLTGPAGASVSTRGSLQWSITGASPESFNVSIYAGNSCSGTALATGTVAGGARSMSYFDLAPNTTYSFKVEAVGTGCNVFSSCGSFTTSACHSNGPTLISPPDGASDNHLRTTFAWDPILGNPTGYEVFVQINSTGTFVSQGTTDANTFELTKDIPAGMHKWYVEGKLPGGCPPARSATRTFGTACPTGAPSLVQPSAGQILGSPAMVTFQWSAVSGADGYDIVYSRNGGNEVRLTGPREGTTLAGTSRTATLPGAGAYTWHVEALSSGCGTLRSASGSFTVTDNCPTAGVTLTAPTNNVASVVSPVTLTWDAQPNAAAAGLTRYRVYVSVAGATPAVVAETDASTTTTTYRAPLGTHSWFVESEFANCGTVRSSTATFTVVSPPSCPAPLVLELTDLGSAYRVGISGGSGGKILYKIQYAEQLPEILETCQRDMPGNTGWCVYMRCAVQGVACNVKPRTRNDYHYTFSKSRYAVGERVNFAIGTFEDESCGWQTAYLSFTVTAKAPCQTNPRPTLRLTTPEAGATLRRGDASPVIFAWDAMDDAISYDIKVEHANGTTYTATGLTGTSYDKFDLPDGAVTWTVTANRGDCGVLTATRTLTLTSDGPCVLSSPAVLAPANASETLSPTVSFRWSGVPNATRYRVYRVTGTGANDRELIGTTTATELDATLDFDDLTFTGNLATLDWFVEAEGAARCQPAQSARRTVRFRRAQNCTTAAPTLSTPAASGSTTAGAVQFLWTSVSGATGYNVWYALNGGAPTKLNESPLAASTTAASYSLAAGTYDWWVEAIFPGCSARESERRLLTVTTPCSRIAPPTILGPDTTSGPLPSPVILEWTRVADATSYDVYVGSAGGPSQPVATVTPTAGSTGPITFVYSASGNFVWKVRANIPNCSSIFSAESSIAIAAPVACGTPAAPAVSVQPAASANRSYNVGWTQVANALTYEVQESTTPAFSDATTITVTGTRTTFSHDLGGTTYYYRVRAKSSCNSSIGEWSTPASVLVELAGDTKVAAGSQDAVLETVFFANPFNAPTPFSATTDKEWLRVVPGSGTMPAAGITLSLVADAKDLRPGTNTGSILLTFTTAAGNVSSDATTVYSIPMSVNVVTPVRTQGRSEPPADALIIPAVAASEGANGSQWVSDARVTNASAENRRYVVAFTRSANDASRISQQTTVDIEAGQTMALDDVLRNWFGARLGENVSGVIEIRSLATGATTSARRGRQLLGASRTYNQTASGTYGQFIPAVPVSEFAGRGEVLTLSEINQSAAARTNLGLVEGSGKGATVRVTAFDGNGTQLKQFDQVLRPGEHVQLNSFLAPAVSENARVTVEVTSETGSVMAYVSVVDNQTNDPLLVTGDVPVADTAWVVAGAADLDTGAARWRTDVRIFNPTAAAVNATLVFYPSGAGSAPKSVAASIPANGTRELKDILRNSFAVTGVGGAVHVTTATATPLLVTARTYNQTTTGTYGQFIPGVPRSEAMGVSDGAIQIQQLEESADYRTNIGLAEVTGKPVTVELIATVPGQPVAPRRTVALAANEFVQLLQVFKNTFGLADVYNARLAVRVVEGDGKIIAYGSVIDQKTQDPTFIPAEK